MQGDSNTMTTPTPTHPPLHLASNNPLYLQLKLDIMLGILCLVYPYFCQPCRLIVTHPPPPIHPSTWQAITHCTYSSSRTCLAYYVWSHPISVSQVDIDTITTHPSLPLVMHPASNNPLYVQLQLDMPGMFSLSLFLSARLQ